MKSKSLIKKQIERKNNQELVKTIIQMKKNKNWLKVAEILTYPRKRKIDVNISKINEASIQGKTILVPGKVLSQGEINKKIKIVALNFSEKAKEKLKKANCEVFTISEEVKKNPEMKGVILLK